MEPKKPQSTPTNTTGGVILGKYQLGRLLGKGSFAKVYYAKSLNDDTSVAVKVIDKAKTVDAAMEPRIVREVSAMRRLSNHPNILKIHEVLATKSKIYLVMELAAAGDLSSTLLRRRRFTETTARRYFQQLVSALHFCHRHGVSHRDIKPQNLLLDSAGTLKISDFGLSALHDGGSVNNLLLHTACGTPAFAAPEVACRRSSTAGYDGEKADAWSCGVILFLFLTGTLPFDDSNLSTMYRKIHRREFEFPQYLSKQSRFIIRQLLDPNPNSRMSIETLMNQSWFKKSLQLQQQSDSSLVTYQECKSAYSINAFDIISMSSGLDLSGLFESNNRREKRFTSKESVEVVEGRVLEVSGRLGFRVEREKGRGIGLKKGRAVLVIEIVVVSEELVVVVVKVVDGGVEFEEVHWDGLRVGFEGISLSCHNDVC